VRVEHWVLQADVLAHAAAVVCHGASRSTLGALAAGFPIAGMSLLADHP
jgi:UDP:flavonoid glycosyltransferase YjiC (YdhE family)